VCGSAAGNGTITTLDLGQNGIADRGAAALAEGLKLNTKLEVRGRTAAASR
jgi:hypothetical protein